MVAERAIFTRAGEWELTAAEYGLDLPGWDQPATPQDVWEWVIRLGIDPDDYLEYTGWEHPASMIDSNPDWPLRAFVGEMIEQFELYPLEELDDVHYTQVGFLVARGFKDEATGSLKSDFQTAGWWDHLAEKYRIELPPWTSQPREQAMKDFLKELHVSWRSYVAYTGEDNWEVFRFFNPRWPIRAWAGLILEAVEAKELRIRG